MWGTSNTVIITPFAVKADSINITITSVLRSLGTNTIASYANLVSTVKFSQ